MNELCAQNLGFLRAFNPSLVSQLEAHLHRVLVNDNRDVYFDERLALSNIEQTLLASFNGQLSKPNRLRMVRIQNQNIPLSSTDLARKIVDRHGGVLMANLPNLHAGSKSSVSPSSPLARDWLILGSLTLLPVQALLAQPNQHIGITSITLVEADIRQLLVVLQLLDLQELIKSCRSLNIGFHLIYEDQVLLLQEALYSYMVESLPLALHGMFVFDSPLKSPALEDLRGWLFAQSGIGYRFLGTLGSTTDELNQLMASAWNALMPGSARWVHAPSGGPASLEHTAIIVGSGPSLDEFLPWISRNQDSLTLIAAGSSVGSLLRSGIIPDAVVFLERGTGLYEDLEALVLEGYDLTSIRLFASITTDPRLRSLFADVFFFQRPASTAIALFPDRDSAALLHAGPESNNAAVDVALHLGFARLLLVGCDFAATDRRYPRSLQAAGESPRSLEEPVRGSKGRTVFSDPSLLVARDALHASLRFFSSVEARRLGEGAEIPSALNTSLEQLELDGWLKPGNPWPSISKQCPLFEPADHNIASCASEARALLPGHAAGLLGSLEQQQENYGWNIQLHRQFAPLFPQYPQQQVVSGGALLIHRLYREILFYMLAPLVRLSPGSTEWVDLVGELADTMGYCEVLFDAVLIWVENLTLSRVACEVWDPAKIADELADIVASHQRPFVQSAS